MRNFDFFLTDYIKAQTAHKNGSLGKIFHYFYEIDSTNNYLKKLQQTDAIMLPHGTVAVTQFQSAGKGRRNRSWIAPPNTSLLFSTFVRLAWPAERLHWLTMLAGIAVVETVREQNPIPVALKWPNDLVLVRDNQWHKWGGILVETQLGSSETGKTVIESAVIGIGLNINITKKQLPASNPLATSLCLELGREIDRAPLLAAILAKLDHHLQRACAGQSPHPLWEAYLCGKEQTVKIENSDEEPVVGRFVGVDAWGQIEIAPIALEGESETGEVRRFAAGDVSLRPYQPDQNNASW